MAQAKDIKFKPDAKRNSPIKSVSSENNKAVLSPQPQIAEALEDDFEKEWNDAISGEEFWDEINKTIHTYFKTKK